MPLDTTIALVDLREVKQFLGLDPDTATDKDEFIETLINAASQELANDCNREFIKIATAVTEIWDGDNTIDRYTRNAPIISDISTVYYRSGNNWNALTNATFTTDKTKGLFYFTDGNLFWEGTHNWKISYTYGWQRSNVPADLKKACIYKVVFDKKLFDDGLLGIKAKSFEDQTTTYDFDDASKHIRRIIAKYKRWG